MMEAEALPTISVVDLRAEALAATAFPSPPAQRAGALAFRDDEATRIVEDGREGTAQESAFEGESESPFSFSKREVKKKNIEEKVKKKLDERNFSVFLLALSTESIPSTAL